MISYCANDKHSECPDSINDSFLCTCTCHLGVVFEEDHDDTFSDRFPL